MKLNFLIDKSKIINFDKQIILLQNNFQTFFLFFEKGG